MENIDERSWLEKTADTVRLGYNTLMVGAYAGSHIAAGAIAGIGAYDGTPEMVSLGLVPGIVGGVLTTPRMGKLIGIEGETERLLGGAVNGTATGMIATGVGAVLGLAARYLGA